MSSSHNDKSDLSERVMDNTPKWRAVKPFGAGLKRKHVQFIPASTEELQQVAEQNLDSKRGLSVADVYLSLVLPASADSGDSNSSNDNAAAPPAASSTSNDGSSASGMQTRSQDKKNGKEVREQVNKVRNAIHPKKEPRIYHDIETTGTGQANNKVKIGEEDLDVLVRKQGVVRTSVDHLDAALIDDINVVPPDDYITQEKTTTGTTEQFCPLCNLRVIDWKGHVRSIAHMSSEEHSKGPHHLNRQSEGYKHMVNLGWDPENREGLGPQGAGIRFPVKASVKKDHLGIGAGKPKAATDRNSAVNSEVASAKRQRLLTAKEVQAMEIADRTARQQLHDYLRR